VAGYKNASAPSADEVECIVTTSRETTSSAVTSRNDATETGRRPGRDGARTFADPQSRHRPGESSSYVVVDDGHETAVRDRVRLAAADGERDDTGFYGGLGRASVSVLSPRGWNEERSLDAVGRTHAVSDIDNRS
jgi:hypothetical protein